MTTRLSAPDYLTDQGFVFTCHNPGSEQFLPSWQEALTDIESCYGELIFAFDKVSSLYFLQFPDVLTFSISLVTKTIDLWPACSLSQDTLHHYLIDQLLPRIVAAQGSLVLHGGAVSIEGKAIAFMGESGAGKSTLVASLHVRGLPLINDDSVVISARCGQFLAHGVYPGLRLLPDSLDQLFTDQQETAYVSGYSSKKRVAIPVDRDNSKRDMPLQALFFLSNKPTDKISLRQLAPLDNVMAIIANCFVLNPTDNDFNAENLARACKLAEKVPAYELNYPRSYEALVDVHQAIFDKLREL